MIFDNENWIVGERTKRGLSQFKLAKILDIPNTKLCSWEKGKSSPSEDEVQFIKKKLEGFDRKIDRGAITLRRLYQGRAKQQQPRYLTPDDWKSISINYPDSYLVNKSIKKTKSKQKKHTAIALFAGCGGMSLGFKWADFNVVGFVELEESARHIYKQNFSDSVELGTDVLKLTDKEILSWKKRFGEIDVLCGGPPCQGFSLVGKRDENDYRNQLYKEYQRIAELIRPKAFVLENVRLLTSMKDSDGKYVVEKIVRGFELIGYSVYYGILNAVDYGVPQSRERVVFIGVDKKLGIHPSLPEPSHTSPEDANALFKGKRRLTFKDACADLKKLEAGKQSKEDPLHWTINHPEHVLEWLRLTPEGKSAHENDDPKMRPPSGYNTTYKRLKWDEPSSTISTNFNMISGSRNVHPTSTRSLTIREAMRCQSFPDDFQIIGNWGDARTAIGNAVPPLLAESLAAHIKNIILKGQ